MNIEGHAYIALRLRGFSPHAPNIDAEPPEWTNAALCLQVDPEMFFPDFGQSNHAAKKVCRACPVTTDCLQVALRTPPGQDHGIWGGTSERERAKLRRRFVA